MRYTFGGTPADGLIQAPSANGNVHKSLPNLSGGTFWSAQVGGTQYADLVATGTDPTPITTDADGYVRPFQGPDGVEGGWVDFGGGRRYLKGREVGTVAVGDGRYAQSAKLRTALARTPDSLITGTITRDANGAATSADVTWPDGTPGTYTALTVSSSFPGAVDSYSITYGSPATATYTQPTVTRDSSGAATTVPAITVS